MGMGLISNRDQGNHYDWLRKMAGSSDTLAIVSPFLSADIGSLLDGMPSIKNVKLYTNLDGFDMAAANLNAIYRAFGYCKEKSIRFSVRHNDRLHGKVYFFYSDKKENGFIITSGNFTEKGLKYNHEYGVLCDNAEMQKNLFEEITKLDFSPLVYADVVTLKEKADSFLKEHPTTKQTAFRAKDHLKKKATDGRKRFWLKPLGTSKYHYDTRRMLSDDDPVGLSEPNPLIAKGDVIIGHAVGPSMIIGWGEFTSDEPVNHKNDKDDRWSWKYPIRCLSEEFSSHWHDSHLKTRSLVEEFTAVKNDEEHITAAGTDTIGSIQWGAQILEITKEFAQFVIDRISQMEK